MFISPGAPFEATVNSPIKKGYHDKQTGIAAALPRVIEIAGKLDRELELLQCSYAGVWPNDVNERESLVNELLGSNPEQKHGIMAEGERLLRPGYIGMIIEELMTIDNTKQLQASVSTYLTDKMLETKKLLVSPEDDEVRAHTPNLDASLDSHDNHLIWTRCALMSLAINHSEMYGSFATISALALLLAEALDMAGSTDPLLELFTSLSAILEYTNQGSLNPILGPSLRLCFYRATCELVFSAARLDRSANHHETTTMDRLVSNVLPPKIVTLLLEATIHEGLGGSVLPRRTLALLLSRCSYLKYDMMEGLQCALRSRRVTSDLVKVILQEKDEYDRSIELGSEMSAYFYEPVEVLLLKKALLINKACGVMVFDGAPQVLTILNSSGSSAPVGPSQPILYNDSLSVTLLIFHDETTANEAARLIQAESSYRFPIVSDDSFQASAARVLDLQSPRSTIQSISFSMSASPTVQSD
ncbi:hypothetical protein FOL47_008145 [Perkinsus chesapeaki]|uniref:Uncharacterized protein n=1 Tax=Perkinsus chesapeaki TaxID=330153 RepID=A0A7J6LFU0_PERCH|nr:hypothetical protein FOL47_008145 [Perkinsus chesapeaki]